jgi:membrane protein implicated in regulation of membrane protease activity
VTALALYLGCLAFGGLLLVASIFGGHDDHHDHPGSDHEHHGPLVPLLSLRFWTFALAFFGLTGAALTAVGGLSSPPVAAIAAVAGLATGYGAARLLDTLRRRPLGVVADAGAHIGREGRLLLPVDRRQPGKVRLSIGGASTDFVAETQTDEALAAGTTVLVVGFRGSIALVERTPAAPSSPIDKELA